MSPNGLIAQIENMSDQNVIGHGLADTQPIPSPSTWCLGTFATALARSNSAAAYILSVGGSNEVEAVRWKAGAANTDIVRFQMMLDPRKRLHTQPNPSSIYLILRARKLDTTGSADEDATLGLSVQAIFQSPKYSFSAATEGTEADGTGFVTSTADQQLLPAKSADNAPAKFRTYFFELTKGLTNAQKALIGPMSTCSIKLGIYSGTDAVATALAAEVLTGGHLYYHRHFSPWKWISRKLRGK